MTGRCPVFVNDADESIVLTLRESSPSVSKPHPINAVLNELHILWIAAETLHHAQLRMCKRFRFWHYR